jgi:hypothetical protein
MAPELTLTDTIEKNELLALYNFLKFDIVEPSSTLFKLNNSSDFSTRMDAQLVGTSENNIFSKGVGIAYLEGITKHSATQTTVPSGIGSYVRLPEQKELQDLLYNKNGATFEAWVYTPGLDSEVNGFNSNGVSSLYRLILANENTGLQNTSQQQADILKIKNQSDSNACKGIIFGFTRDRRLTKDQDPSNNSSDNNIDDTCLVLAPTQSFNSSSVGFINKSYDITNSCFGVSSIWYSMRHPVSAVVNGVSLSACNNQFCQITLTLDPIQNNISLYCDGQLLTTSSYNEVFGINPIKNYVNIPTLKLNNSFEYNRSSMSSVNVPELKAGPKLDQYFTPWIVGGGYTDGMQTGNFMGGQYGGIISGLRGFIGGLKFYSKPLSNIQVLKNFNASKNFFKNIDIPSLNWEPIISE